MKIIDPPGVITALPAYCTGVAQRLNESKNDEYVFILKKTIQVW
jgi:hypothetical protein